MQWSPKQMRLVQLHRMPQRIVVAAGSVRSGKSEAGAAGWALWTGRFFSGQTFLISARSMTQLWENVAPKMARHAELAGIQYKEWRSKKYIRVGSNKLLTFEGGGSDSAAKLQGLTLAGAFLDDAAILDKTFVTEVVQRCSIPGAKIMMNCNPKGPSHWLKTEYIDRPREADCAHLQFGLADNPSLTLDYIAHLIRNTRGHIRRRNVFGEWAAAIGAIYPHVAYHDGIPADMRPIHYDLAVDYGASTVTHALLIAQDGHRSHVVDEWVHDTGLDGHMAASRQASALTEHFKAAAPQIRRVYVDPAALGMRRELEEIYGRRRVRKADNDVALGIEVTGHMLTGEQLTVGRECPRLKSELGSYEWDWRASERGEDAPVKMRDHGVDALRYWAFTTSRSRPTERTFSGPQQQKRAPDPYLDW